MNGSEMTVAQRIAFLERAVEELKLELSKVEVGLGDDKGAAWPVARVDRTLKEHHTELANILKAQQATLRKILSEARAEMEKLKRGSSD